MSKENALLTTIEAAEVLNVSKPTFKKMVDIVCPKKVKVNGKRGFYYDPKEIYFLEVKYLRALADIREKEVKEKYFLP